ncbi:MAG: hypothetical protein H6667_13605 [Ardenticatenaceae bacterium]|nr:hypothetical protein [Ardenticatenaceae bacterium]MCB9445146.1 hypothetical protein [Ardenticatenaceae bacterium]
MTDDIRVRCTATTKSGKQCRNYAQAGQITCYIHAGQVPSAEPDNSELRQLVNELDSLLADLKNSLPESSSSPYSPVRLLSTLRQNLGSLSPEMRLGLLQNFEGMTKEDLLDIETWKGMAYMMSYSARFQADQAREKMNEHLPTPLKPDTWINFFKQTLDKVTPGVAKDIAQNLQGATKEDLMDPDTWKGVWYMLDYSLRFQAEQFKQKLTGQDEEA